MDELPECRTGDDSYPCRSQLRPDEALRAHTAAREGKRLEAERC